MLPKAHLTSHSTMSVSRWVTTPSSLSGLWRSFLYSSFCILATSSYYLLLLLGPYHFCPLLSPSLHEMFPWYLYFLEEISSLSHSVVFLYFFALTLRKAFLSLLAILWNSAFKWIYFFFSPLLFTSLLFTAICKASSDSHSAFLHFFFLGMVLIPVSCTMSQTS